MSAVGATGATGAMGAIWHWRLPWHFDVQPLLADVAALAPSAWQLHFNTGYHDGGWSGLALLSSQGDARQLYGGHQGAGRGRPTALLAACPGFAALLDGLPLQIQSARLLRLAAGSHIREHADDGIGLDAGTARLHIPIATGEGVEFHVNGTRVPMAAGECWYLDLGLPHRVQNTGAQDRVHLVLDCTVDAAFRALLPSLADSQAQLAAVLAPGGAGSQQRCQQFLATVMAQAEWPAGWADIEDPKLLAVAVQQAGAAQGLAFTVADVLASLQAAERRWLARKLVGQPQPAAVAPLTAGAAQAVRLPGWTPLLAEADGEGLTVELCRTGAQPFTAPFFGDTLDLALRRPAVALLRQRVRLPVLADALRQQPGLPLGGLIFHLSRCGSTLFSQVLATTPRHRVLSEPGPLDTALQAGPWPPDADERLAALRTVVGALAQPGRPTEQRCLIKLDSWHCRQIDLLRRAFPEAPWVFLMRDPVEIIVSHLRQPGAQMVPGLAAPLPPGLALQEAAVMPRAEYAARLLGACCQAVLASWHRDPRHGLLVDYSTLQQDLDSRCLPHLGVRWRAGEAAAARAALARDAKQPHQDHQPDGPAKQAEADAAVRAAAERWVMPAYRALKALAASARPTR